MTKYFNIVDQLSWAKFDEYADHIGTIHYVKFNKKEWLKSVYSCWFWAKNYYCKHTIGLAVYKKRVVYKDIHKTIQIGQTRPRGQPRKTKSALDKQADYSSSSETSSSESSSSSSLVLKKKIIPKKKNAPKKRGPKPKK